MNNTTNLTDQLFNKTNSSNIINSINDYNFVILLLMFIYNLIIMCFGKNIYYNIVNRINNNNDKFNIINKVLSSYINTDATINKKQQIIKRRSSADKINNNDIIARELINIDI